MNKKCKPIIIISIIFYPLFIIIISYFYYYYNTLLSSCCYTFYTVGRQEIDVWREGIHGSYVLASCRISNCNWMQWNVVRVLDLNAKNSPYDVPTIDWYYHRHLLLNFRTAKQTIWAKQQRDQPRWKSSCPPAASERAVFLQRMLVPQLLLSFTK